jgi:putative ABC transport system substrate-binding protein
MNLAADDPESLPRITVFVQSLPGMGWTVGHNLQIDYRFGAGDVERYRRFASELVAAAPDVLVTASPRR